MHYTILTLLVLPYYHYHINTTTTTTTTIIIDVISAVCRMTCLVHTSHILITTASAAIATKDQSWLAVAWNS